MKYRPLFLYEVEYFDWTENQWKYLKMIAHNDVEIKANIDKTLDKSCRELDGEDSLKMKSIKHVGVPFDIDGI